ncbi:Uncharacterised protein [Bordetella pertussis]|nr:Uncharacterised protein [Bordetella pertussis]
MTDGSWTAVDAACAAGSRPNRGTAIAAASDSGIGWEE